MSGSEHHLIDLHQGANVHTNLQYLAPLRPPRAHEDQIDSRAPGISSAPASSKQLG